MSFRAKLLLVLTLTVTAAVAAIGWGAVYYTRQEFDQFQRRRSDAVAQQFQRELTQRGNELVYAVQGLADAESTLRMALDLNRPQADPSIYVNDAHGLAESRQLDFLELAGDGGVMISSAQWPERVGSKSEWLVTGTDWNRQGAFLSRVEEPDSAELGLLVVRVLNVGGKKLYLVGGRRLDSQFLRAASMPEGMRALLYRNLENGFLPTALTTVDGPAAEPERFSELIGQMQQQPAEKQARIEWSGDAGNGAESFSALPLTGRDGALMGVLLLGSDQRDQAALARRIEILTLGAGGGALLLGAALMAWLAGRVTRPLARMTGVAREVAAGNWSAQVNLRSTDEAGRLAQALDDMTRQLRERHERVIQTERVSAWREMALRVTNELKPPLLRQQSTVELLASAQEQDQEQLSDSYLGVLKSLRADCKDLQDAVARFSDFAKMPAPRLQAVSVNDSVRAAIKAFEPRFNAVGRPPVTPELYLDDNIARVQADAGQLAHALESLVARSLDSMPAGGSLTIRTSGNSAVVRIEVSDTGAEGLDTEDAQRGAGQQYAATLHGTGLGLATVQSVICEHGGRISVQWVPGAGTTFLIELPAMAGGAERAAAKAASKSADDKLVRASVPATTTTEATTAEAASHTEVVAAACVADDAVLADAAVAVSGTAEEMAADIAAGGPAVGGAAIDATAPELEFAPEDEGAATLSALAAEVDEVLAAIGATAEDLQASGTADALVHVVPEAVAASAAAPDETLVAAAVAAVGGAADSTPFAAPAEMQDATLDADDVAPVSGDFAEELAEVVSAAPPDWGAVHASELEIAYALLSATTPPDGDATDDEMETQNIDATEDARTSAAGEEIIAAAGVEESTATAVATDSEAEHTVEPADATPAGAAPDDVTDGATEDVAPVAFFEIVPSESEAPVEEAHTKEAQLAAHVEGVSEANEATPVETEMVAAELTPLEAALETFAQSSPEEVQPEEPVPVPRKRYSVVIKTLFS